MSIYSNNSFDHLSKEEQALKKLKYKHGYKEEYSEEGIAIDGNTLIVAFLKVISLTLLIAIISIVFIMKDIELFKISSIEGLLLNAQFSQEQNFKRELSGRLFYSKSLEQL